MFDEFWTRFLSDPSVSLKEAFNNRWVADVHPPLFSLLVWLTAHVDRLRSNRQGSLTSFHSGCSRPIWCCSASRSRASAPFWPSLPSRSAPAPSLSTTSLSSAPISPPLRLRRADNHAHRAGPPETRRHDRQRPSPLVWLCHYPLRLTEHPLSDDSDIGRPGGYLRACSCDTRRLETLRDLPGHRFLACAPFIAFLAYQWGTIERVTHDYWLKTNIPAAVQMIFTAVLTPTWQDKIFVA